MKKNKFKKRAENKMMRLQDQYDSAIRVMAERLSDYAGQDELPLYRVNDIESDLKWVQKAADEIKLLQTQLDAIEEYIGWEE